MLFTLYPVHSYVVIATGYRLERRGSIAGVSFTASIQAVGPTQPSIRCVPGVKGHTRGADKSLAL
jgi:hypothetical protein